MQNTPYGLIFDVDGVIADTESLSATITAGVLSDLFNIQDVTYQDFNAGRGRGAEAYLKAAASCHGYQLTNEQVLQAETAREERFLAKLEESPLPAYPGVLNLIENAMNSPDINLAIATSSTRTKSMAVLTSAGVPYKELVYISGSDVSNKKPHPELFLTAAKGINIAPNRCLVIEDAPSGIESAINAGCKCMAVTNSFTTEHLDKADRIVDSLENIVIQDITTLIDS